MRDFRNLVMAMSTGKPSPTSRPHAVRAACFNPQATWGKSTLSSDDGWTLDNNPCAWGAQNPRFLLLGFSKGERQSVGILNRLHDEIPYAGFRPHLTAGFAAKAKSFHPTDTIDAHIRSDEQDWAFGSIIRCALAKGGRIRNDYPVIGPREELQFVAKPLYGPIPSELPPRLQIVVMLSNDDGYIETCRERIAQLHPELVR